MNLFKISVFVLFYSLITNTYAVKIETDQEKLSYSMGIFFGQTVIRQEMEIDVPAFMQAVEDVLNKNENYSLVQHQKASGDICELLADLDKVLLSDALDS